MYKVLIVDDEAIARNIVRILLDKRDDVEKVFEASNSVEALRIIENNALDIVFLDIQMPGDSGLELARHIPDPCAIIFATAYHEHAVAAFELHAVDYLLKPFDDERFTQSFERATMRCNNQLLNQNSALLDSLKNLMDRQDPDAHEKLVLKETGKIKLIDYDSIKFVKGAGNYVEVVLMDGTSLLQRETLRSIEEKLNPTLFSRIHKSTIVRVNLISELRAKPKGDYTVVLSTGDELCMSRRNKSTLSLWRIFKH